jgi:dTDP-glucose pyrophosphorylase
LETQVNPEQSQPVWRQALLPASASMQEAIRNLDRTSFQIVMVVNPDGTLVGTITDGDIRRGLLRGLGLDSPVEMVLQRNPLVAPPELGREAVADLMQANKVSQMPVVDRDQRVAGLHVWGQLMSRPDLPNLMVIMCGGKGTRLLPHTENCPKPMLPVNGKPMLEHIIERAKSEGFHHFVLAIHYLGHMIEDHFGDGSRWQVKIDYLREDAPLGTAGAIALFDIPPVSAFLVTNGDVLTDIRYADVLDFHRRHGATATMAVRLHEWQHPFGVVRTSGVDIVGFEEKPVSKTHINAGIYVLEPRSLGHLCRGEPCDMPALFARLQSAAERTIVYPMHEPWLDVGRPEDYRQANGA